MSLCVCVLAMSACKGKRAGDSRATGSGSAAAIDPAVGPEEAARRAGPGFMPMRKLAAKIFYTPTEITVDGEPVINIAHDGTIKDTQFQALVQRLEDKVTGDEPVGVELDSALTYSRVSLLFGVLENGGFHSIALIGAGGMAMVPLVLIDAQTGNSGSVRPIVSVAPDAITLWSASGKYGTKQKPLVSLRLTATTSLAPITKALGGIVDKEWSATPRSDADRTIVLAFDPASSADLMIRVCAAVRADASRELFPNIFMAGG